MGIYDGEKDITLSDVFKRTFSPDPIEIPVSGISGPLLEQLEQEMALSEEIQEKFKDVCKYMLEHRLHRLSLENELVNFDLTMNRIKKEAADDSWRTD